MKKQKEVKVEEKPKKKLTQKIWENKVQALCKLLDGADKDFCKSYAAEWACIEIAVWGGEGHHCTLGILEEAKLNFREISLDIIEQEVPDKKS
jgi:hypothetical protein